MKQNLTFVFGLIIAFVASYAIAQVSGPGVNSPPGVSCTAGTMNITTMVTIGGIVTHC